MIDTYDKTRGPVTQHLDLARLEQLIHNAQCVGLLAVVAGGLKLHELPAMLAMRPDYIGVRGAVCCGGREGQLNAAKVSELLETLATNHCRQENAINR